MELSRHKFKKLGTIVEHLMRNIDVNTFYVTQHGRPNGNVLVQIWPLYGGTGAPLWWIEWHPFCNSKLEINTKLLKQNAEW